MGDALDFGLKGQLTPSKGPRATSAGDVHVRSTGVIGGA